MPRVVIFDLYHTLVGGGDEERERVVQQMGLIVGVPPADLVAMYNATWRDRLVHWDVEETLRILAGRLGATPSDEQVAQAAALRRALARRRLDSVVAQTLDSLDALRANAEAIVLVSNATSETAEAWPASTLASRFDACVFSCEVGVAKPDPAIYRLAAARVNADPVDCLYVGDGADGELAGAAAVGMTVVRTAEHNDTDPSWPGPVITSLADLLPRLA